MRSCPSYCIFYAVCELVGAHTIFLFLFGTCTFALPALGQTTALPFDGGPDLSLPEISGELAGVIADDFSVNESGSAFYDINIALPPGTAGVIPKLDLVYDSRGGNTVAGLGWSLSGLSSIGRCPTTLAQDGYIDGVDFDANDKFCLDGQRLISIQGEYGASNTEYRTENETFSRIVSIGVAGLGPQQFILQTKSGMKYFYASTEDSRVEAEGRSDVLVWQLSRVEDTLGNFFTITYFEDNTIGESYPTRIDYTGNGAAGLDPYNTVEFAYEPRSDITPQFIAGSKVQLTKRLSAITLLTDGVQAWRYSLTYQESASKHSELISVQECGGDGKCLKPTIFTWSTEEFGFADPVKWYQTDSKRSHYVQYSGSDGIYSDLIDMNGDGRLDRVSHSNKLTGANDGVWVQINNGVNFDLPAKWAAPNKEKLNYPSYRGIEGIYTDLFDLTGDGLPDKIGHVQYVNGNLPGFWIGVNSGTGFENPVKLYESLSPSHNYPSYGEPFGDVYTELKDMNGDGLADRIKNIDKNVQPQSVEGFWVDLNNGNGFSPSQLWFKTDSDPRFNYPVRGGPYGIYLSTLDMNADGLTDRIGYRNSITGEGNGFWVALSTGTSMAPPEKWYQGHNDYANFVVSTQYKGDHVYSSFVDMNGDQLPDRVAHFNILTGEQNGFWVALNTGAGFAAPVKWYEGYSEKDEYPVSAGSTGIYAYLLDINFDGLPDRISHLNYLTGNGGEGFWVGLNTGSGFEAPTKWYTGATSVDNYPSYRGEEGIYTDLQDINGDGFPDRVGYKNHVTGEKEGFWVALNKGRPAVIESIQTGHGHLTNIKYLPLTDSAVYIKDSDAVYPAVDLQSSLYVVSSYDTDDGVGGFKTTSYFYEGLKSIQDGRGYCGFRKISENDETSGITNTTYYRQDHPYKSMPYMIETHLPDGTLINRKTDTWEVKTYSAGNYFPYVSKSVEDRYDLDGTPLSTTTIEKVFDDYGNTTLLTKSEIDGHITTTISEYDNDLNLWHLGRLRRSEVTDAAPGHAAVKRVSTFDYHPQSGLLVEEVIEPGDPIAYLTKSYLHDQFGNIVASTISGAGVAPRASASAYDSKGQFAIEETNALGYSTINSYDIRHGKISSSTDPNGLTTTWKYDSFSRLLYEERADGTKTRTLYYLVEPGAPAGAVYYKRVDSSGQSPLITYYDILDREIRRETIGVDGRKIFVDTQYNERGELVLVSDPYFEGDASVWTVNEYDIIGRITRSTAPGNRISTSKYTGYTTINTNPLGQVNTTVVNSLGQLIESRDNLNQVLSYTYDSAGNLIQTEDPASNLTTIEYDVVGNRKKIIDPDSATTTFTYNGLGQVTSETNAENQTVTYEYDLLGRLVTRNEVEGISTWKYDTEPFGIGKIAKVQSPGSYSRSFKYDTLGRIKESAATYGVTSYVSRQTYDGFGRVSQIIYPSGFAVRNNYNSYGYLTSVSNTVSGYTYWQADSINARGQLEQQQFGNGLSTTQSYDSTTGFLKSITTVGIQNLSYQFDAIGNLRQRQDLLIDTREDFEYDQLNRLVKAEVQQGAYTDVTYDGIGNITSMSGVGTYYYGENGAGPHAVTSIVGAKANSYGYDVRGNRISDAVQNIQYSSYGKPIRIVRGSKNYIFSYGANRKRYEQITEDGGQVVKKKRYISELYECELLRSHTICRHYISGSDGIVAVRTTETSQPTTLQYIHKDHLGSIQAISNDLGGVVEILSFDSWGNRRNSDWTPATTPISSELDKGFTEHEMLDEVGLIHMNGRVYDPTIGRFLSADPNIQAPENIQSLNRYSYVMNNPLSYTDPSGFLLKGLFKSIGKFFKKYKTQIIASAVFLATSGWGSGFATFIGASGSISSSIVSAAVQGSLASASSAGISGGSISDIFKSAISGGLTSAASVGLFSSIGEGFGHNSVFKTEQHLQKIVAHGAAGGALELAQGGKFQHGFISSAFVEFVAPGISALPKSNFRVAVASVTGGLAAQLSGGKFANGAITSAFARLYNGEGGRVNLSGMTREEFVEFADSLNIKAGYWNRLLGEPAVHVKIADDLSELPINVLKDLPSGISGLIAYDGDHKFNLRLVGTHYHISLEANTPGVFLHYDAADPTSGLTGLIRHGIEVNFPGRIFNYHSFRESRRIYDYSLK